MAGIKRNVPNKILEIYTRHACQHVKSEKRFPLPVCESLCAIREPDDRLVPTLSDDADGPVCFILRVDVIGSIQCRFLLRGFNLDALNFPIPPNQFEGLRRPSLTDCIADQVFSFGQIDDPVPIVSSLTGSAHAFVIVASKPHSGAQGSRVVGFPVAHGVERRFGHVHHPPTLAVMG